MDKLKNLPVNKDSQSQKKKEENSRRNEKSLKMI